MPRANAMVPPDAIRIEDEVWQEAFTRREPARPSRDRRLRAMEAEQADWLLEATGGTLAESTSWPVRRPAARERRRAASSTVPSERITPPEIEAPQLVATAPDPVVAGPIAAPRPTHAAAAVSARTDSAPVRRTIKIQGRGAERNLPLPDSSRRRPPRRGYERTGFRPDRLAMWAVVLGFVLVLIAIISAHA